jgi:chitosanase
MHTSSRGKEGPMNQLTIPCADCEATKARLLLSGFTVAACEPVAGRADTCLLSFEEAATPAARALAMTLAAGATADAASPAGHGITPFQARAAQAIVNLFETGSVLGVYGQVTLIPGDSGHLTYGRSQTTLASGNLAQLVQRYCANPGARLGLRLAPYLPRLFERDAALDHDGLLANLLRAAADDPVMRDVQDAFFDDRYWQPALRSAAAAGLRSALGVAVVYDSTVHGSWEALRRQTDAAVGTAAAAGEQAWVSKYVETRRAWLAGSARVDLRATVYRMDAFRPLIEHHRWGLDLPVVVRGQEISTTTLAGAPPGCFDGPVPGSRALGLEAPLVRGLDVRMLQLGLSQRAMRITADGVYGPGCASAVRAFQAAHAMPATGVADVAMIASLAA